MWSTPFILFIIIIIYHTAPSRLTIVGQIISGDINGAGYEKFVARVHDAQGSVAYVCNVDGDPLPCEYTVYGAMNAVD